LSNSVLYNGYLLFALWDFIFSLQRIFKYIPAEHMTIETLHKKFINEVIRSLTCEVGEAHGHHVGRVDELVERLLYQVLRLVASQARHPAHNQGYGLAGS
jgi:hypothetical protein